MADNIKKLREDKNLLQKVVAAEIGLKPAHYNKIEKGLVEPSVEVLDKLAAFYGITIDEVVHLSGTAPKAVQIEDKTAAEQLRLIAQLGEKDKTIIMSIIDTMLTPGLLPAKYPFPSITKPAERRPRFFILRLVRRL